MRQGEVFAVSGKEPLQWHSWRISCVRCLHNQAWRVCAGMPPHGACALHSCFVLTAAIHSEAIWVPVTIQPHCDLGAPEDLEATATFEWAWFYFPCMHRTALVHVWRPQAQPAARCLDVHSCSLWPKLVWFEAAYRFTCNTAYPVTTAVLAFVLVRCGCLMAVGGPVGECSLWPCVML